MQKTIRESNRAKKEEVAGTIILFYKLNYKCILNFLNNVFVL